jgi:hypothetical protein
MFSKNSGPEPFAGKLWMILGGITSRVVMETGADRDDSYPLAIIELTEYASVTFSARPASVNEVFVVSPIRTPFR